MGALCTSRHFAGGPLQGALETDWLAGHVKLELGNPHANHVFENSVTTCVGSAKARRERLFAFELLRGEYAAELRGSSPTCPATQSALRVRRCGYPPHPVRTAVMPPRRSRPSACRPRDVIGQTQTPASTVSGEADTPPPISLYSHSPHRT